MAGGDLFLRSDSDKSETSPDPDIRLRSQSDKEAITGTLNVTLAAIAISAAGISEGAIVVADWAMEPSLMRTVMEYGFPRAARRARAKRGAGGGLDADVLKKQREKLEAIFDDEELMVELLDL